MDLEEYVDLNKSFDEYFQKKAEKIEIFTEIRNEEIERCLEAARNSDEEMAIRILVNLFDRISGNLEFTKLKYKVMIEGFVIGFNINKVSNKQFEQYQDSNKIRIFGCEKINIEEYWLELQMRRRVMERIISMQFNEGLQQEHGNEEYD